MTLFIYILGYVATIALLYFSLDEGNKITTRKIIVAFLVSTFSWISFIVFLVFIYSDRVLSIKKLYK